MASIRNKSEHRLYVRAINQAVDPDEQVDVPDDVFKIYDWPDTVWDVVKTPAKRKGE